MVTRRAALQLSTAALGLGIAGCTTPSTDGAKTTTDPPTATTPDATNLQFQAEVEKQQTMEAPARVQAKLQN